MKFVLVPAGTFVMGSDERPERLALAYPQFPSTGPPSTTLGPSFRFNNFRNVLDRNPCPA